MNRDAILPLTCMALVTANIAQLAVASRGSAPLIDLTVLVALGTMFLTAGLWYHTAVMASVGADQARDFTAAERAHVSAVHPDYKIIVDGNRNMLGVKVSIGWRNSGRTPASPMITKTAVTFAPTEPEFVFDAIDHATGQVRLVLGPGGDVRSDGLFIGREHIIAAAEGRGHQYFSGYARYRDIFPKTPEHVIEFCFKLSVDPSMAAPVPPEDQQVRSYVGFVVWPFHNRYYDARDGDTVLA